VGGASTMVAFVANEACRLTMRSRKYLYILMIICLLNAW
jgi:hypothetical protein